MFFENFSFYFSTHRKIYTFFIHFSPKILGKCWRYKQETQWRPDRPSGSWRLPGVDEQSIPGNQALQPFPRKVVHIR